MLGEFVVFYEFAQIYIQMIPFSCRAADSRPYGARVCPFRRGGRPRPPANLATWKLWVSRQNVRPHRRGRSPDRPVHAVILLKGIELLSGKPLRISNVRRRGGGLPRPAARWRFYAFARALLPPSLREVASGVPRKPDDGRSTPSVIAASGADSSLGEGAVESLFLPGG